ncbi:hypothetical protein SAMN05660420_03378 [Desulfuromusa kysingii]|uniref:DKNYY family protein n=1 Tax=Desulfuromusa kysingii TaxID=37625 RepID=A0A1H4EGS6_9BACT|nr:hypothetical protein [Desulfuromusa kysingii]SEA84213.1 hypothetical protein SAMN05660420_03378 [Desulfuromusa kysingii]
MKKLIWKLLAFTLLAIILSACAAPKYNYQPEKVEISEPPIGSTNIAYVGDSMLRQGKYIEHDTILLRQSADIGWAYTAMPGYYLKQGSNEKAEFYYPSGGSESGQVTKAALADPWKCLQAYKEEQKLCVITVFNALVCKSNVNFERLKHHGTRSDSFQQTLIYSGKFGEKINIGYREFSNSTARPAFNNDVEYDLRQSKIIGYKGAKIEIIEATNELIKYRVIRNFNKAKI